MVTFIAVMFVLTIYFNKVAANITTYYLAPDCGQPIDLIDIGAILLKLIAGTVQPDMNCYRLITSSKVGDRLMLYFKDMNIAWSQGCGMDWLELHDGTDSSSPYVSGLKRNLCGNSINSTVHSTTGNYLYVRFRSGKSVLTKGFDLVITQYHTGPCNKGEYTCKNGHCIPESLVCDGYNPCGDDSDCVSTTATPKTTTPTTKTTTSTTKTTTPTTKTTTTHTTKTTTPKTKATTPHTAKTTFPTTPTTVPVHPSHVNLTTGAIVAIVVGSFALVCVLACCTVYCWTRRRRMNRVSYQAVVG